ncbi:hypothetical protein [Pseudomonas nitroreducens]|uniref:hypothetical protein n=1 Tax=Pseudomonas nitroreducens TaxID=46680 RepID=UPI0020A0D594|nr:hypothetical protein [Pseudomonas nitroreducens]MCP1621832.1 hypothetical protein [Pseudomonas nitroreducens]
MLDDLPTALLGRLLRLLLLGLELVFEGLLDALFNRFSYLLGWLLLRALTLGRKPRGPAFPDDFRGTDWLVQLAGALVLLAMIAVALWIALSPPQP